jgi:hypothetical protein
MRPRAIVHGVYRYALWRHIGDSRSRVLFIMLNPSTADETIDDPTIRRCTAFARRWGYGRLEVCNLFAYRATDPRELRRVADPVGPLNDAMIARAAKRADCVVVAWGVQGARSPRADIVTGLLGASTLCCVGSTLEGFPRHPLYVRSDSRLAPWHGRGCPMPTIDAAVEAPRPSPHGGDHEL